MVVVAGGQRLDDADEQAADNRTTGRVEAADDGGRESVQRREVRAVLVKPGSGDVPRKTPATVARAPATIQDTIDTRPRRMPMSAAASASSAVARVATPQPST